MHFQIQLVDILQTLGCQMKIHNEVIYLINTVYWMGDFVCKLMGLSHKNCLARNLMRHHKTKNMMAIKTKEELLREADTIAQQCLLNIEEKYSWLLDVESTAHVEMGYTEVQYSIFELCRGTAGAREKTTS